MMPASTSKLNASANDRRALKRSPTHPGAYVKEGILDAYGLTQQELADAIGMSRLSVNEIVRGKRNLTESTALRLAQLTGTSVEMWLDFQRAYSLWNVEREEAKAIAAIKPLKGR
jgi:antitoxin HigA-1